MFGAGENGAAFDSMGIYNSAPHCAHQRGPMETLNPLPHWGQLKAIAISGCSSSFYDNCLSHSKHHVCSKNSKQIEIPQSGNQSSDVCLGLRATVNRRATSSPMAIRSKFPVSGLFDHCISKRYGVYGDLSASMQQGLSCGEVF
jgi:hypothetical protein